MPGPDPARGRTNVVLLSQPRSGASQLEAAVFSLAAAACLRDQPTSTTADTHCSVIGGRLHQSDRNFSLGTAEGVVHFTVCGKHRFPPAGYPVNNCTRASAMMSWAPCQLALFARRPNRTFQRRPAAATVPALIDECAQSCNSSHATLGAASRRFLMIYRDPRASARSHCLWQVPGGLRNYTAMRRCVRRMFPIHASWLKYREVWLTMNPDLRRRTTLISYERLSAKPMEELAKVASVLGLRVREDSGLLAEVARNMSASTQLDGGDIFCDSSGEAATRMRRAAGCHSPPK